MNAYRKILVMVADRKNSKNYTFDGYLKLHLEKAGTIFNRIYNEDYIEKEKVIREDRSLVRVDKFISPDGHFIQTDDSAEKKIKKKNLFNTGTGTNEVIRISSTQTQALDETNSSGSIISIPSTQTEIVNETHASFTTVRDDAISSLLSSQDLIDSEPPRTPLRTDEINTEEVINQPYDHFDLLVLGQEQSTQLSEPLNQYFMFTPNQEKANDINWDDS